jgi:hypothetical protein
MASSNRDEMTIPPLPNDPANAWNGVYSIRCEDAGEVASEKDDYQYAAWFHTPVRSPFLS